MFKTNEEIIVIQAKATTPIPTGVVFWSHDKGTAKMIFQLQKDCVNQTLSEGTIVPICLDFVGGRHIYHAVIEDAVNGIVSIVLEDNILGYQGSVDGSIYIELPDSRSLDTAGRFTFDIKRSPIDLNTPELDDYYWQGFNEIMAQYHQTIATIKLEAKTLLDSLTADVTTAQNKVTTLEQSITTANTNLNTRINEINKKIDDNDVFTKQESSANVIYQLVGKEKVQLTFTLNYIDKIADSVIENANSSMVSSSSALITIPAWRNAAELSTENYTKNSKLDNLLYSNATKSNSAMIQKIDTWNVLEVLKRELGEAFFISQGASDVTSQIAVVKQFIVETKYHVWGAGSSSSGNKLSTGYWLDDKRFGIGRPSNATNVIREITGTLDRLNSPRAISNDGTINVISYAEASDGTTASTLNIDYASLDVTIELSANEYLMSLIAANHVENLATPEEAKAGTDTTKTMTPATTAQSIDNRAVTLASNQTIGGLKNFENTPLINDIPAGIANEACWCEDFAVNNLAAGIVNPDLQRFSTTSDAAFSMSGKVITIKKSGVYLIALGVNYTGLTSWLTFGISRVSGTALVNRNLIGSTTSGSNSFTYVRSFEENDQIRIEFNSGAAGTTMQKINLAIVKIA